MQPLQRANYDLSTSDVQNIDRDDRHDLHIGEKEQIHSYRYEDYSHNRPVVANIIHTLDKIPPDTLLDGGLSGL